MKITFRKGPSRSGRMQLADNYSVNCGGKQIATIQGNDRLGLSTLWYWYGDGLNFAHEKDTLENVKAQVIAHFKKNTPP